jgi:hypothetical protein
MKGMILDLKMRSALTVLVMAGVMFMANQTSNAQTGATFLAVPGWVLQADSARYGPDNLYDIIDGAADGYLGFGFVELLAGNYRTTSGSEFRLEVYRHDSEVNAFGVYAQERKPEYHFVDGLGAEGYDDEGIVNFLHGKYYVKLSSHDTGSVAHAGLLVAARAVSSRLGAASRLPSEFSRFPKEGKRERSEYYIAHDFLGYSALGGAFVVPYRGKQSYQQFLIRESSREQAVARLAAYLKAIKKDAPEKSRTYLDPHNGRVGICVKGQYVVGVVGIDDANACVARMNDLLQKLP